MPDKRLPQAIEAEEAVLGSCLIDPEAIWKVFSLRPEAFYREAHGLTWAAMQDIARGGRPVDFVTLMQALEGRRQLDEIGGPARLTELINAVPTAVHVEHYAAVVQEKAHRRRLIQAAAQIARWAYDEEVEQPATKALAALLEAGDPAERGILWAEDLWEWYFEILRQRAETKITGIASGYLDLDLLLGGLRRGEMIVVAGRPGMGKSTLAECLADNAAGQGKRVLFASLETSSEQLADRRVVRWSGVGIGQVRSGRGMGEIQAIVALRSGEHIDYLDDPNLTTDRLLAGAFRARAVRGLDMLIVDYLQLLKDLPQKDDTARVTHISGRLKALARELNVPLVAISQLSRQVESRGEKKPRLADLRQSGALEQDADAVLMIYRERYYNPGCGHDVTDVELAKNRNGPTGEFQLLFLPERFQFVNLEKMQRDDLPF